MDILVEVQFFLQSGLVHSTHRKVSHPCVFLNENCAVYNKHTVLASKTRNVFMQVTQYIKFTHNELFFIVHSIYTCGVPEE